MTLPSFLALTEVPGTMPPLLNLPLICRARARNCLKLYAAALPRNYFSQSPVTPELSRAAKRRRLGRIVRPRPRLACEPANAKCNGTQYGERSQAGTLRIEVIQALDPAYIG